MGILGIGSRVGTRLGMETKICFGGCSMKTKWTRTMGCVFTAMVMFALLFVTAPMFAQQAGTIMGVVKDTSGGTVPQAKITVTNTDTSDSRTATTGDDGAYRVPGLR